MERYENIKISFLLFDISKLWTILTILLFDWYIP